MPVLRQNLIATVVIATLTIGFNASAQEVDATTVMDTLIVTGTRAKDRTVLNTAVPVDVFTQEDLRRAGAVGGELGQALAILLPSFNFPRQSNSGGSDHIRAAQLRGMSPDQVLVLINGKRRHTSAVVNIESKIGKGTAPVDFNSIPVSAVKRVEVLRDGAGAQYGSDAIAGVVNVILNDATEGGLASISYGAHHTDVAPINRTVTDGQTISADAQYGFAIAEDGFFRFGVELKDRNRNNRAGFDQIPFFEEQTPANLALAGKVNYRVGDPDLTDRNFWVNTEIPLPSGHALYGFATYNSRDTLGAAFFRYPDSRNNVPAIYPEGFRPDTVGDNSDLGLSAGLRGIAGEWDYDASLTYGGNHFESGLKNSLNASLGVASPTRFILADYDFDQLTLNADVRRSVEFDAIESPLTLAFGAEYRRESFQIDAGDLASYAVGPFTDFAPGAQAGPGLTPADEVDASRNVYGLYGDFSGDVTERLFLGAAARYENYQRSGSKLTGKLSGRYAITPVVALRGAVSNNFRAPALAQQFYQDTISDFGEGGQVRTVRTLAVSNPIAQALGAKNLEPETSVNGSLGLTVDASENFNVALDLFQINVKDRITLSERIGGDDLSNFIQQNFGIAGIDGVNFFTNAVDTRTRGADLVLTYRTPLATGDFTVNGSVGYAKTSIEKVRATPPELAALGFNDVIFGVEEQNTLTTAAPRQKIALSGNWRSDDWSVLVRGIRHGATTRVFNFGDGFIPEQTYNARYQLDAELEYRITEQVALALGGSNITDQYPELSNEDIYYFGNLPYDVLSGIGVNGAFWYGRVNFKF